MKAGWQVKKLGDVCELINGRAYKKEELLANGKYPVLRVGNFFTNNNWYYSNLELEEDKYCDEGDLLYAWSASFGPRIWTGEKSIYHYHIWKVLPDQARIEKSFLYLFFLWDTEKIKRDQGAGTTMIHVAKGSMEARAIQIPPLAEQQRLVALLDEAFAGIDAAKANAEQNLNNARALFDGYLAQVFSQRGEGWSKKTLGEIASVKGGKRVPKGYKFETEATDYPYITVSDFNDNGSVDLSNLKYISAEVYEQIKRYTISTKDLYLSIAGTIGKTGIVPDVLDGANLTENACKLVFHNGIDKKYVYYFTKSDAFVGQAGINTRVAAQPKLALERLKTIVVPIPDLDTQQAIVAKLDALSAETKKLEAIYRQKSAALDELKQSLLHQAFTGEL